MDIRHRPRSSASTPFAAAGFLLIVMVLAILVVLSPFLFGLVGGNASDWARLGNIGQAYGAIGSIFSGIALAGVAVSLLQQRRQIRLQQVLAVRERHFELSRLGLEVPHGTDLWFNPKDPAAPIKAYANLWVGYWSMQWELKLMDEDALRSVAASLFKNSDARDWWGELDGRWSANRTRDRVQFEAILSDEWRHASARLNATAVVDLRNATKSDQEVAAAHSQPLRLLTAVAFGLSAGVLAAWFSRKLLKSRERPEVKPFVR